MPAVYGGNRCASDAAVVPSKRQTQLAAPNIILAEKRLLNTNRIMRAGVSLHGYQPTHLDEINQPGNCSVGPGSIIVSLGEDLLPWQRFGINLLHQRPHIHSLARRLNSDCFVMSREQKLLGSNSDDENYNNSDD